MKTRKLLLFIIGLALCQHLSAQNFHLMLFSDPYEEDREKDRRISAQRAIDLFQEISTHIGYRFDLQHYTGSEYRGSEAMEAIADLDVGNDDIVVFYYQGHGYNDGEDKWPTLDFSGYPLHLSDALAKLNPKCRNAKTTMVIGECCNSYMNANGRFPSVSFSNESSTQTRNFKALFTPRYERRTIILSSSVQGEYSWSNLERGSYHNIALDAMLRQYGNASTEPTWNQVLDDTKEKVMRITGGKQVPQYKILVAQSVTER